MPETPPASQRETFYVTTPIYYVNARPHIGHAYTTVAADVLARRHRLLGHDTFFLTGTDEHGQKIERSARAAGIEPQAFADQVAASFRSLWDRMGITYTDFIRTTEPRHKQRVQHLFRELQRRGAIYKSTYTGQYCVSDEAYVDGPPGIRCPDCGRVTETVSEENYYFRLSLFQLPLLDLIEPGPNGEPPHLQIQPDSRRNEVLSFLRGDVKAFVGQTYDEQLFDEEQNPPILTSLHRTQITPVNLPPDPLGKAEAQGIVARSKAGNAYVVGALKDLSISRTSFSWGIPVPDDPKHVIYVWLDALANYMTAVGYGSDAPADQALFARFWPADLHLVGKEIIRFHCVYWPAFLLALNDAYPRLPHDQLDQVGPETLPELTPEQHRAWAEKMLPKAVTAHGWLLFEESKMSKSRGNIVRTETILDAFGDHYSKELVRLGHPEPTKHDADLFASDVLRYFLLREIPFGQDGTFSFDALIQRYNSDLVNDFANLVSRTLPMIARSSDPLVPKRVQAPPDSQIIGTAEGQSRTPLQQAISSAIFYSKAFGRALDKCDFATALGFAQTIMRATDGMLSAEKPWKIDRSTAEGEQQWSEVLYTAAESIRIITALLHPILPFATARVWAQLGLRDIEQAARDGDLRDLQWGGLEPSTPLGPLSPIFPRADKGLAQIMTDMEAKNPRNAGQTSTDTPDDLTPVTDTQTPAATEFPQPALSAEPTRNAPTQSRLTNEIPFAGPPDPDDPTHPGAAPRTSGLPHNDPIAQVGGSSAPIPDLARTPSHTEAQASGLFAGSSSGNLIPQPAAAQPSGTPDAPPAGDFAPFAPQVTIDDFIKLDLRVARIVVAERIPKADKLLRLEVDLGSERRQILSGIAQWYTPEELLGRRIVVIANLAPRKMRGLDSHGMLLAASHGEDGKPILATFAEADDIPPGARLK